jgi:hypothetical protein
MVTPSTSEAGWGAIFSTIVTIARRGGQPLVEQLCRLASPSPPQTAGTAT